MSFIDFEPKPQPQSQPSFSEWLQQSWENPHPQGLFAMIKRGLNMAPDLINASIAATGPAPSTEEEAFLYNLARDRGVIGALGAASTFGPASPQFVGSAIGRYVANKPIPQALVENPRGHPSGARSSNPPPPNTALVPPDRSRTRRLPSSGPIGSVPIVRPPAANLPSSGGLLGRLRELESMERRSATNAGLISPENGSNFRQLSRIVVRPLDTAAGAIVEQRPAPSIESPLNPQTYSEWLAQRKKNYKASSKTSRNPGNNKKSDSGDEDDFCTKRKYQEEDECSQRWEDGEFAHKDHYWGCKERAVKRWDACNQNGGWPPSWELPKWSMDPDEEVYINTDR